MVRAADVQAVARLEGDAPRPLALGASTSQSPNSRPRGCSRSRVIVAATKQCVAPSSSGTSAQAAARRASGSRPSQSASTSAAVRRSRIPALRRRSSRASGRVSGTAWSAWAA